MKVLDPGHTFLLDVLDSKHSDNEELIFVKRRGPSYPGNDNSYAGTTSQEVIRALIARAIYVNNQIPCAETSQAIELLRAAILLFEQRAKRVKGKTLDLATHIAIEDIPTCSVCGHILCEEHVR
jgi:hypothetical protein